MTEREPENADLVCPKCGATGEDFDGFGTLVCPRDPACWCSHPSRTGGVCGLCGDVR